MRYLFWNMIRSSYNAYRKKIATGMCFSTGSSKLSDIEKKVVLIILSSRYILDITVRRLHVQQFSSELMFSDVVDCSVK